MCSSLTKAISSRAPGETDGREPRNPGQSPRVARSICRAGSGTTWIAARSAWSHRRAAGSKCGPVRTDRKHRQLFLQIVALAGRACQHRLRADEELEAVMARPAFV